MEGKAQSENRKVMNYARIPAEKFRAERFQDQRGVVKTHVAELLP